MLLKFITGSSRLNQQEGVRVEIQHYKKKDSAFPVGHTCGFSVDVPAYSSLEVMMERFRTAMSWCGEIDDDGDYMSGQESYQSQGEGESSSERSNRNRGESSSEAISRRSGSVVGSISGEGEDDNRSQSGRSSIGTENLTENRSSRQPSRRSRSCSDRSQSRRSSPRESFYSWYAGQNSYYSDSDHGENDGERSSNSGSSSGHGEGESNGSRSRSRSGSSTPRSYTSY